MRLRRTASHFEVTLLVPDPWAWWLRRWRAFWGRRAYRRMAASSLPDGTRVRLTCQCSRTHDHDGVWTTSWTPRRVSWDSPDDYELTREGDGETTYATRGVLEVVRT